MKHTIILLLALTLLSCSEEKIDFAKEKDQILKLLTKHSESYKEKNIDKMMDLYLNDSNSVAYGTNKEFIALGWDAIKKEFSEEFQGSWQMAEFEYQDPDIKIEKNIAWLVSDVNSKINVAFQGTNYSMNRTYRITAVLKKVENQWKFVLTNFQEFGQKSQ